MKLTTPPPGAPTAPELDPSPHVQARILAEALPHLIQYDE
jgi:acetylglutamate kinase